MVGYTIWYVFYTKVTEKGPEHMVHPWTSEYFFFTMDDKAVNGIAWYSFEVKHERMVIYKVKEQPWFGNFEMSCIIMYVYNVEKNLVWKWEFGWS